MSDRVHYTHCPICGSTQLSDDFRVKDYTVSAEQFQLVTCQECTLRFTQDVPTAGDISHYYQSDDYISHTDTSKGFINRLYHTVRRRMLRRKRRLVEQVTGLHGGNILDVGSGTGAFLREMKVAGWKTTGLEPDAGARRIARENQGMDLEEIERFFQLPEKSFDAITLWHVLEHVHDLQVYIAQLKKLLKEKGRLIIAVPNYTSLDAVRYREYWAAYDVPRHLYHFSPKSMEVLMARNGLKVQGHQPLWYDSFYISLLSSKYKHGKTSWWEALWTGLKSNTRALQDVKKCSSVIYIISHS